MLIRFVVNNFFSFGEMQEFNTIPNARLRTLAHHKYKTSNFHMLKTSAIYGANGAGKSNLVKSIRLLKKLALGHEINQRFDDIKFKLKDNDDKQTLATEFIQNGKAFYYGIEISNNLISTEELYLSGLGKKEDQLIYERKTNKNKITNIKFFNEFENDDKNKLLLEVLLEEFIKPDKTILHLLANKNNKMLKDVKTAFKWFDRSLQIINPNSKPNNITHIIERDKEFKKYAEDLMCAFNIGITSLITVKKKLKDVFKSDYDSLCKDISESPSKQLLLRSNEGGELLITEEDGEYWVKHLELGHTGPSRKPVGFVLEEESDGTIRLLDFVPAFRRMLTDKSVFVIDEIERSIHPLLIKELISKFSSDETTKGQLIFTTHESNLLDQNIFRQDEIWFTEKDSNGSTEIYSLSDFKEHKTIDVQKGYLTGRYGSIPFLGNLRDLNWHNHDIK